LRASEHQSQQRVLRAFAFGEERQRLAGDVGLEMRALLMRLEGSFVAKQFLKRDGIKFDILNF
jgi:hypothetical protein